VGAGNIVGVLGLKVTGTGETLCDREHPIVLEPIGAYEPVISMAVETEVQGDREKLDLTLRRISDEDPTFRYREDPDTGQTVMSGMGELHLDIVADRLRRDFGIPVRVGRPEVVYAETVTRAAEAAGVCDIDNDEAKVFARLVLRVTPAERGTGGTVQVPAMLPGVSPVLLVAARTGIQEALKGGVLHGLTLTDVDATVVSLESREGRTIDETAVKIAAMHAVREACGAAAPARMAPIGAIEIVVPGEFMGEVLGGLQARRGIIESMEDRGPVKVVRATAPIERMFGYATELRSATQGRGTFAMQFARYDVE
ncbi:MAG TPA: elongation factor G, partial [Myxococcota bacterium]|nr:elongation factor G [Myxococcota bacterium]